MSSRYGDQLVERLFWLIRLRWIAVVGVVLTVLFAYLFIGLPLPIISLFSITFVLAVYNLIFYFVASRIERSLGGAQRLVEKIANIQISLDLLVLTALIHFSGGIENPFIFYFIFHMIIGSILLSRRASFLQATFAAFLFTGMVGLEYWGILPHYPLRGFISATLYNSWLYVAGVSSVFVTTLYIAVYMASSISIKLREREKSLEEANKQLEEKDRIKSEYVLRVSHDIKEHIAAIQICVDPVVEGIAGPLNAKQKDLLERADRRASKLIFFVNALLEITRIKLTRELRMESFSLLEVLESIKEDIKTKARNKNQTFKMEVDPSVDRIRGVRVYIEEAILNLLHNSVKYTPEGGVISLKVEDRRNNLRIEIKDNGIGISAEDLPQIFDEFYRAKEARQLEKMGSGLGTSIAKKIVEMHGGGIWVESEEGKGTTFFIEIKK
jgi:signal transduction histidine kinase